MGLRNSKQQRFMLHRTVTQPMGRSIEEIAKQPLHEHYEPRASTVLSPSFRIASTGRPPNMRSHQALPAGPLCLAGMRD